MKFSKVNISEQEAHVLSNAFGYLCGKDLISVELTCCAFRKIVQFWFASFKWGWGVVTPHSGPHEIYLLALHKSYCCLPLNRFEVASKPIFLPR